MICIAHKKLICCYEVRFKSQKYVKIVFVAGLTVQMPCRRYIAFAKCLFVYPFVGLSVCVTATPCMRSYQTDTN